MVCRNSLHVRARPSGWVPHPRTRLYISPTSIHSSLENSFLFTTCCIFTMPNEPPYFSKLTQSQNTHPRCSLLSIFHDTRAVRRSHGNRRRSNLESFRCLPCEQHHHARRLPYSSPIPIFRKECPFAGLPSGASVCWGEQGRNLTLSILLVVQSCVHSRPSCLLCPNRLSRARRR